MANLLFDECSLETETTPTGETTVFTVITAPLKNKYFMYNG